MCLEIVSSKKIAIEDMTVYKVIHANNTSAARLFHYEPGVLYTLAANDRKKFDLAEWDTAQIVNEGFHAYGEKAMADHCHDYRNEKTVAFTIPKGAQYYLGTFGTIVSDAIVAGSLEAL